MPHFDRFDICAAHNLIEILWNRGGWVPERPSNQRRKESTGCQLARIQYRPADSECTFGGLSDNAREIYRELCERYGFTFEEFRKIRISFSRTTPESAEQGDTSETGWINEEGVSVEDYDDLSPVEAAVKLLNDDGACYPSSTHFHPGVWYSTEFQVVSYQTGEEEERSFHLENFTQDEEREIFQAMTRKVGR